jgi:DUF1680 family protein
MIRGCAEFLKSSRDSALEEQVDGYIQRIVDAQSKDPAGYLNTHTQLTAPDRRWGTNGGDDNVQHDVHNAGCLVEAGVAYYQATGKIPLLRAAARLANHMSDIMGPPPKINVIPGHSLPEEALVRLFALFQEHAELKSLMGFPVEEKRYLSLAEYFIEGRGNYEGRKSFGAYGQDQESVFQQTTIEGHAVRATLMGAGLAALATVNNREEYMSAATRLWNNMVGRRLYITGGVGAVKKQEKFGADYELPNDGYLETCAAVGNGFYSRNMHLATGESRYMDELERVLYNGALGGASLIGNTFSYINPLEFNRSHARWSWTGCPGCPPMFLKMMGEMPSYIYAQDSQSNVYINLFVSSRATMNANGAAVTLSQQTNYPWDVRSKITVESAANARFDLCIRVPAWCEGKDSEQELYKLQGRRESGAFKLSVNGTPIEALSISNGYARISREWSSADRVEVVMEMPARRVTAPSVEATKGRVAVQRGPIVYALELLDLACLSRDLYLPSSSPLERRFEPNLFGGVMIVEGRFRYTEKSGKPTEASERIRLIPYFAYLNRGPADMAVWMHDSPEGGQVSLETTRAKSPAVGASPQSTGR